MVHNILNDLEAKNTFKLIFQTIFIQTIDTFNMATNDFISGQQNQDKLIFDTSKMNNNHIKIHTSTMS